MYDEVEQRSGIRETGGHQWHAQSARVQVEYIIQVQRSVSVRRRRARACRAASAGASRRRRGPAAALTARAAPAAAPTRAPYCVAAVPKAVAFEHIDGRSVRDRAPGGARVQQTEQSTMCAKPSRCCVVLSTVLRRLESCRSVCCSFSLQRLSSSSSTRPRCSLFLHATQPVNRQRQWQWQWHSQTPRISARTRSGA